MDCKAPGGRIAKRLSVFYRALTRSAEHAATIYGGRSFALAFGGNEMPGYHTGPARRVGWLVGARHSDRDTVLGALAAAGFSWSADDLERLGAETLRRKIAFKQREGFGFGALRIPQRIIETPSPAGPFDEAFVRRRLRVLRSWCKLFVRS